MAVVQSAAGLVAVNRGEDTSASTFLSFFEGDGADLGTLYKTQPEVRACVDFLVRNLAQLPIKVFTRVSDTSRERITDGPLVATLNEPAPGVTKTRWLGELVSDLAVYANSYHIKVRSDDGRVALIRVPPSMVTIEGSWLRAERYKVTGTAGTKTFPADQVMHIAHGFNPDDARLGLSPLESLRVILAEQAAATKYREAYWRNAARMSGIIERPGGAPAWSDAARARFRAEWEATYTGAAASGKTVVLEEGMQFKPVAFSARDSQYLEAFQLTREVVATAYGIPIGLLGLGSFTYASLSEQHRQLYADCLAPWLVMLQEELEAQLLVEFATPAGTYIELDVDAKLQGSLEERARILQATVGAPYVTRNEARAKLNLPALDGGDELVTPLNVITGGQASPQDSVPVERVLQASAPITGTKAADDNDERVRSYVRARDERADVIAGVVTSHLRRQRAAVTAKLGAKTADGLKATVGAVYDRRRFARELARDLRAAGIDTADELGTQVAARYGNKFNPDGMANFIDEVTTATATGVIDSVADGIADALVTEQPGDAIGDVFDNELGKAALLGLSVATSIGNTARVDAAGFANAGTKTWVVTSGNPRSSHIAVNGQTVAFADTFANGLRWPGDSAADAEERANCTCLVEFN